MAEVAAAAKIAGSLIKGVGAFQAGRRQKAMDFQQALEEEGAGEAEVLRLREQARQAIGGQLAAQWSNGMEGGTGSAIDSLRESQINAALDQMLVRRDAAMKARSLREHGKQAKREGTMALISSGLDMVGDAAGMQSDWAAAKRGTTKGGGGSSSEGDIVVTRGGRIPVGY